MKCASSRYHLFAAIVDQRVHGHFGASGGQHPHHKRSKSRWHVRSTVQLHLPNVSGFVAPQSVYVRTFGGGTGLPARGTSVIRCRP